MILYYFIVWYKICITININLGVIMIEEKNISTDFRDLSGRLKAIGIFQIILGSLSAFFALVMLAMASALKYSDLQRAQLDPKSATMALTIYIIAAIFFIWVGVASIKCHRWVRPVVLSLMVPSLVMGVMTFIYMAYTMPLILDATMQSISMGSLNGSAPTSLSMNKEVVKKISGHSP